MIRKIRHIAIPLILAACMALLALMSNAQAQVGLGETYTTLKAAFDAINAGTLTCDVVLQITSSPTEAASAVLNASGKTCYTSVFIYLIGSDYTICISILPPLTNLS